MKIHLKQIPVDGAFFEGSEAKDIFQLEDPSVRMVEPVKWAVDVGVSDGGLWVHGTVSAGFELECVSCLRPFIQRVCVPDFAAQVPLEGPEMIDLTEQVREDILLNLPVHPRCDWNGQTRCEGIHPAASELPSPTEQSATNGQIGSTSPIPINKNHRSSAKADRSQLQGEVRSGSKSPSKTENSDDAECEAENRDIWRTLDQLRID